MPKPMTSRHNDEQKPLFNRTYLKLLPVLIGAVIVWLTYQYRHQNAPEIIEWAPTVFATKMDELKGLSLSVNYAIPSALSLEAKTARKALELATDTALTGQSQFTARWSHDKLTLTAHYPDETRFNPDAPLKALNAFASEVDSALPNALERAKAELYLEQQSISERALTNATTQLAVYSDPSLYQNVFDAFTLLISAPKLKDAIKTNALALSKAAQKETASPSPRLAHSSPSLPQKLRLNAQSPLLLLLQPANRTTPLNGDASTDAFTQHSTSLLITHLLAEAMQQLPLSEGASFRVIYQPAWPKGYQGILLTSSKALSADTPARLQRSVLEHVDEAMISTMITRLVDQYRSQLEQNDSRQALINDAAFYGWHLPAVTEFRAMLEAIPETEIHDALKNRLAPEISISVWVP
jgi:hypothetical protein